MRHARLEERKLQVPHLFPVDHFRVQIEPELVDKLLDVVYRNLGIPARIDMKHERTQAEHLFRRVREIRAVDAAAHADDAVEVPAFAFFPDRRDELIERLPATLVRVPVRENLAMEGGAVIAYTVGIEGDLRVGGVHHTNGADLVRPVTHRPRVRCNA